MNHNNEYTLERAGCADEGWVGVWLRRKTMEREEWPKLWWQEWYKVSKAMSRVVLNWQGESWWWNEKHEA